MQESPGISICLFNSYFNFIKFDAFLPHLQRWYLVDLQQVEDGWTFAHFLFPAGPLAWIQRTLVDPAFLFWKQQNILDIGKREGTQNYILYSKYYSAK